MSDTWDLLSQSDTSSGDLARASYTQPALPTESPADTGARLMRQDIVSQRNELRKNQQFAQQQRVNGADFASRSIPTYRDDSGAVQPVTDSSGAPLTNFDKKNSTAWDSMGAPMAVNYQPSGPPEVKPAFEGVPVTTDPKTGNQYRIRPGLPYDYQGQDTEIAAANDRAAKDKAVTEAARAVGGKLSLDEHAYVTANHDFKNSAKQFDGIASKAGITPDSPVYTAAQTGDLVGAHKALDDQFNTLYGSPEANATAGLFSKDLSPAAQAYRTQLDQDKAQAHKTLDSMLTAKARAQGAQARADATRQAAQALQTERTNAALRAAGMPELDASTPASQSTAAPAEATNAAEPAPSETTADQPTPDQAQYIRDQISAAQSGQKPYAIDKDLNVKISDDKPLDSFTEAVKDGILPNAPPEVWKALEEKQKLIEDAGSHPEIKAALAGAGRGAAFMAAAPLGAGIATLIPGVGEAGGIGQLLGGLATGSLAAYGYGKAVNALAAHNDTINSFVASQKLHPYYAVGGELATFAAGLPRVAMKAVGGAFSRGADAAAEASSISGDTAAAIRAALNPTQVGANMAASANTADAAARASSLLDSIGSAYASSGGGALKTYESVKDMMETAAIRGDSTAQKAAMLAKRAGTAAAGMVAIDTALKEGSHALGFSDEHQTIGGAGVAAMLGLFAMGHGVEARDYDHQDVGNIILRGLSHAVTNTPMTEKVDLAKLAGTKGITGQVSEHMTGPLTPEEEEIYRHFNVKANQLISEGKISGDPTLWKTTAKQILFAGRKGGLAGVDISEAPPERTVTGATVGEEPTPSEKPVAGREITQGEPNAAPAPPEPIAEPSGVATPPEPVSGEPTPKGAAPSPPVEQSDELAQQQTKLKDALALQEIAKREGQPLAVALHGKDAADAQNRINVLTGGQEGQQVAPQAQPVAEQPPAESSLAPAEQVAPEGQPESAGSEPAPVAHSNAETLPAVPTEQPPAAAETQPPQASGGAIEPVSSPETIAEPAVAQEPSEPPAKPAKAKAPVAKPAKETVEEQIFKANQEGRFDDALKLGKQLPHKANAEPASTKPTDVLHSAKNVKITAPKGAKFLQVVDAKGRKITEPIDNVAKGLNPFHQAGPFKSVTAGVLNSRKELVPLKGPIEITDGNAKPEPTKPGEPSSPAEIKAIAQQIKDASESIGRKSPPEVEEAAKTGKVPSVASQQVAKLAKAALTLHHPELDALGHPHEFETGTTRAESGIETDVASKRIRIDPAKMAKATEKLTPSQRMEWIKRAVAHEVIHVGTLKYAEESPANREKLMALTKDDELMKRAAGAYGPEWKDQSDFAKAAEAARMLIEGPEKLTEASYKFLKDFLEWLKSKLKNLSKDAREVIAGIREKLGQYDKEADATKENAPPEKRGSTQVTLADKDAEPIRDFVKGIPESELYHGEEGSDSYGPEYGRELESHVTSLYGLVKVGDTPKAVASAVEKAGIGPVKLTLGKMSVFNNPDSPYDVLKLDVESPDLHALNAALKKLPFKSDFPDYHPHLTLAYLKKGEAAKYVGDDRFEGKQITIDQLTHSSAAREKTQIPLSAETPGTPENLRTAIAEERAKGDPEKIVDGLEKELARKTKPKVSPPVEAAKEVQQQITKANAGQTARPAKEIKAELVQRLKDAIKSAPELTDEQSDILKKIPTLGKHGGISNEIEALESSGLKKQQFQIPGDGTFKLWNAKTVLADVLRRVEKMPTTLRDVKPGTQTAISAKEPQILADLAADQLGGRDAAIEWLKENSQNATPTEKAINEKAMMILQNRTPTEQHAKDMENAQFKALANQQKKALAAAKPEDQGKSFRQLMDENEARQKAQDAAITKARVEGTEKYTPAIRLEDGKVVKSVSAKEGHGELSSLYPEQKVEHGFVNNQTGKFMNVLEVARENQNLSAATPSDKPTPEGEAPEATPPPSGSPPYRLAAEGTRPTSELSEAQRNEKLMEEAESAGLAPSIETIKGLIANKPETIAKLRAMIKDRTGKDALNAATPNDGGLKPSTLALWKKLIRPNDRGIANNSEVMRIPEDHEINTNPNGPINVQTEAHPRPKEFIVSNENGVTHFAEEKGQKGYKTHRFITNDGNSELRVLEHFPYDHKEMAYDYGNPSASNIEFGFTKPEARRKGGMQKLILAADDAMPTPLKPDYMNTPEMMGVMRKMMADSEQTSETLDASNPAQSMRDTPESKPDFHHSEFQLRGEDGSFKDRDSLAAANPFGKLTQQFKDEIKASDVKDTIKSRHDSVGNIADYHGSHASESIGLDYPDQKDREAAPFVIEGGKDPAKLAAHLQSERQKIATGKDKNLTKDMLPIIDHAIANQTAIAAKRANHDKRMGNSHARIRATGRDVGTVDDYVRHAWDPPEAIADALPHPFFQLGSGGSSPNSILKGRTIATIGDGIHLGFRPKTMDLSVLDHDRIAAGESLIERDAMIEAFKNIMSPTDGKPVIGKMEMVKKLNGDTEAQVPRGYTGVQIGGRIDPIHDQYAGLFKALNSPSALRQSTAGRFLLTMAGIAKHGTLMFDSFHAGRLGYKMVSSGGGTTIGRGVAAMRFDDADLPRAVAAGEVKQEDADWAVKNRPIIEHALRSGANLGRVADNLWDQSGKSNIPIVKQVKAFNHWLFKKLAPAAMTQAYVANYQRNLTRPGMTPESAARLTSKEMNAQFGNLRSQGIFQSKTAQDIASLFALAPNWTISQFINEVRAYAQLPRLVKGALTGKGFTQGNAARAFIGGALGLFAINQLINFITRHKPTWDNEPGHKLDAWFPGGKRGFFFNPFEIAGEYLHATLKYLAQDQNPVDVAARIASNKMSPMARAAQEAITGRDYSGRHFLTGKDRARAAITDALPMPLGLNAFVEKDPRQPLGYRMTRQPGAGEKQLLQGAGMKVTAAQSPRTLMFNIAQPFRPDRGGSDTAGEFTELRRSLDNDDTRSAKSEIEWLYKQGKDRDAIMHAVGFRKDGSIAPELFAGSADREKELVASLKPSEMKVYMAAQREHIQNASKLASIISTVTPPQASAKTSKKTASAWERL